MAKISFGTRGIYLIIFISRYMVRRFIIQANQDCVTWDVFFFLARQPQWARVSSFTRFLAHTRHTTVGRAPLAEWSARRKDLYRTTYHTHKRQTSMPRWDSKPIISAGERPQTYALDRAATGTDTWDPLLLFIKGEVPIKNRSCKPKNFWLYFLSKI